MSNLNEKFVSDDGYSTLEEPVVAAGGKIKPKLADKHIDVDPEADTVEGSIKNAPQKTARNTVQVENVEIDESVAALFDGEELSEDFKKKAGLVFTAAVNEAVATKVAALTAEIRGEMQEQVDETIAEQMDSLVENLDKYLDYAVAEWLEENRVAVASGIQIEMAESFMDGLRTLFNEHNIELDDETIDVVAGIEEELEETKSTANDLIHENISLKNIINELQAEKVFTTISEGLTEEQASRLELLSEKLSIDDLDTYENDLRTLRESFFSDRKSSRRVIAEETRDSEFAPIQLDEDVRVRSDDRVDAYAKFLG